MMGITIKNDGMQSKLTLLGGFLAFASLASFGSFAIAGDSSVEAAHKLSYPVIDTNQSTCSGLQDTLSTCPTKGEKGYGQDAQYQGFSANYTAHNNGTVTDNNTQLMWGQSIDINGDGKITVKDKLTYNAAIKYASSLKLGGYDDWRIPSIKELYSLMMFDGQDPSGLNGKGTYALIPFINNAYFGYSSGDTKAGERLIDAQYVTSSKYVSTTMKGDQTVFGVNFIDGRIKGYGLHMPDGSEKSFYVLAVRGKHTYGVNQLVDNNNGTITDNATSLIWQKEDSKRGMDWPAALSYCEDLIIAGNSNWRLPNVKELQSIVDYSRSPDTTSSASIDGLFSTSHIINEANKIDYANYWSSTTHFNMKNAKNAAYVSFGRSLGKMNGSWIDVHGAGSQRSDPKTGDATEFANGHGPQGDAIRINNYVRCVTDSNSKFVAQPVKVERAPFIFTLTGSERGMGEASEGGSGKSMNRAQGKTRGNNPPQGDNVFSMLDINGDGKISREEVKGPLAKDFDRLDIDYDGYLSKAEIPTRSTRN